ncbi:MAG: hypothetical protein ACR2KV_16040 [Solirubrobacteraceae bacterium]
MSDPIRELLADLPLATMTERPEGMLAIRCADVPEARRSTADAWVESHGGRIAREPLFKVHGGKSPEGIGGEAFYVLPPSAFTG